MLDQLANSIATGDAVVCLVGTGSGAGFPRPGEAAPFIAKGILLPGIAEAS